MNERRRDRLATFIRNEIADFFQAELDVPVGALLSVLYVEIAQTGSRANIFVSVYPPELRASVAKALKVSENKAAHYIRTRIRSKYSPAIRFQVVEN